MEIAKKHAERLPDLKKMVQESYQYFETNINRYNEFIKFVFDSSLTQQQIGALMSTGKPTLQFNILEAYVSKLRGEFAKQQPSITVRAADGVPLSMLTPQFTETLKVIESYMRSIFFDGANDKMEYNIYSDLLAGGFSCMHVFTEYVNEMSFEQRICVDRVFDPTLVGFDPLARDSHKGDGRYCFELYPMTKEQFIEKFGEDAAQDMQFTRDLEGFTWSFKNEEEEIVLVCDFYEKKRRKEKLLKLSNGHTVTEKEYKSFLKKWQEAGMISQPPIPVREPRITYIEYICRYRLCENKVLDYIETNYKMLPLVFVDGNSVTINEGGASTQMTRPVVYHAKGIQMLKNFSGQSLAAELENTIQHKFVVAQESIPKDPAYQLAYTDVQKASTLTYTHFLDTNNPNITLPPPREISRTPIPPEISNTFRMTDEMTQTILGSYNNQIDRADLSGIAIARQAIQANGSAAPYLVGYIKGLNRVAEIVMDLIPKYYRTPRTLPIIKADGKRDFVEINKKGSLFMDYDPNHLQVKVEAGVNFAMQKEISMQTIVQLMQSSPTFAQFMNQNGLQVLLDNIDIRGIDTLKEKAVEFEKQVAAQQQQAQQMQMQQMQQQSQVQQLQQQLAIAEAQKNLNSPTKEQIDFMSLQEKSRVDSAKLELQEQEVQNKFLELMSRIRTQEAEMELQNSKVQAENTRSAIEAAVSLAKHIGEQ